VLKFKIKKVLKSRLQLLRLKYLYRPIKNYYKTDYTKKALLSYIVAPFRKESLAHTNGFEATTWAKILNKYGYQVDIIQYNAFPKKLDITQYDLLCGFGDAFEVFFHTPDAKAKTIMYATGMHICHQNNLTLKRVKDVYLKKGVWLGSSSRYIEKSWIFHSAFTDATVVLGNEVCMDSYKKYIDNVHRLNAPFFNVLDYDYIIDHKADNCQNHFLWFGSSGVIHRGLDLLLDYFSGRNDIVLHICGNVKQEEAFSKAYHRELFHTKNIVYHGFVNIASDKFETILQQCGFVIYPSCSEGGSPSVLTCVGNGGLIPVITKETTVNTGHEIWIDGFSTKSIEKAVDQALSIKKDNLKELMMKNAITVNKKNNIDVYRESLEKILSDIIGVKYA